VLTGFFPGVTYNGALVLRDLVNNQSPAPLPLPPAVMKPFTDGGDTVVCGDLRWGPISRTGNLVSFSATARVDKKTALAPTKDHLVAARVLVNGVPASANLVAAPRSFNVNGVLYTAIPGPFVVSPQMTTPAGTTQFVFQLRGLQSGDLVQLSLEAIAPAFDPLNHNPQDPNFAGLTLPPITGENPIPVHWSLPDTPTAFRCIEWKMP
jgi:hypothetical protein